MRAPSRSKTSRPNAARPQAAAARRAPSKAAETGARPRKTGIGDRWRSYLAHHRSSAMDSLRRLLAAPLQSLMTWLVIAVALALPATLLLALDNLDALGQNWDGGARITLFLDKRARPEAIDGLRRQLEGNPAVRQLVYISPQQALQDFERESGLGQALRLLDSNPLPASLQLTPAASLGPAQLVELGERLGREALVDDVVFDREWVERLHRLLQLGSQLVWSLGGLLSLGVLLVIGNTIRLAIENRRDEVIVVKLVGGSNAFVRRPFLYTGLWYGLGGGLLGLVLVLLLKGVLGSGVTALADAYGSQFRLAGPDAGLVALLLLGGALVGWLGAWLAVGRHLSAIEPR